MNVDFLRHSRAVVRAALERVSPINCVDNLSFLCQCLGSARELERLQLPCTALAAAIATLQRTMGVDFFADVWPKVERWLLDDTHSTTLPLLCQETTSSVRLSESHIRFLLAHAFLGNLNTAEGNFGVLSFVGLFTRPDHPESVERIVCQLCYFALADDCDDNAFVTFERHVQRKDVDDWLLSTAPLNRDLVTIHRDLMEAPMGDARRPCFVDFANRDLMIHRLIPSATQEEILFSCVPSCLVGLLFCERMTDNEVITIKNVRRYCDYTGYLSTFRFAGPHANRAATFDIVALDACTFAHWSEEAIVRDLNKAHNAWRHFSAVSTGAWGCGAFGGDWFAKIVQQLCAASLTNCHLFLSSRDGTRAQDAEEMFAAADAAKLTVGAAVRILLAYKGAYQVERVDFKRWFIAECNRSIENHN